MNKSQKIRGFLPIREKDYDAGKKSELELGEMLCNLIGLKHNENSIGIEWHHQIYCRTNKITKIVGTVVNKEPASRR